MSTAYQNTLLALADPPAVWFELGDPLPEPARAVAIVGSRAASDYGRAFDIMNSGRSGKVILDWAA